MSTVDTSGEPNFYEFLRAHAVVGLLVGNNIFNQRAPQSVRGDFVVYQRAAVERQPMFCGTDGTVGTEYQFDLYSVDDVRLGNLGRAIRRALNDYSGLIGTVAVKKILLAQDFDSVDPDPGLNRRTQTYTVWHAED